jgi:hypothetical protein
MAADLEEVRLALPHQPPRRHVAHLSSCQGLQPYHICELLLLLLYPQDPLLVPLV